MKTHHSKRELVRIIEQMQSEYKRMLAVNTELKIVNDMNHEKIVKFNEYLEALEHKAKNDPSDVWSECYKLAEEFIK